MLPPATWGARRSKMFKKFIVIILAFLTTNAFSQTLVGKTFFRSGPEAETSYSFTNDRFTHNFDVFFSDPNFKQKIDSYFYEIKYEDKIPYIYYWKDENKKQKDLILFNDDYIFIFDSNKNSSFLDPINFYAFCSGKYITNAKGDSIINGVYNKKYSSTLKEKEHEYCLEDGNLISPWVPDLKKDKNPSITFNIPPVQYKSGLGKIIIVNGFVNREKPYLFEQNSRVKNAEVVFKNTETKETEIKQLVLEDTPNPQYIFIPENLKVDEIEIRILDTYKGSKYADVAISYIGY